MSEIEIQVWVIGGLLGLIITVSAITAIRDHYNNRTESIQTLITKIEHNQKEGVICPSYILDELKRIIK